MKFNSSMKLLYLAVAIVLLSNCRTSYDMTTPELSFTTIAKVMAKGDTSTLRKLMVSDSAYRALYKHLFISQTKMVGKSALKRIQNHEYEKSQEDNLQVSFNGLIGGPNASNPYAEGFAFRKVGTVWKFVSWGAYSE